MGCGRILRRSPRGTLNPSEGHHTVLPECGDKRSSHGGDHPRAPGSSKIQGQSPVTNENSGHLFEKY